MGYREQMGDHWWWLLIGGVLWTPMLIAIFSRKPKADPNACPECDHEEGLNETGSHCGETDDNHLCRCQNDYHWNYESTAI